MGIYPEKFKLYAGDTRILYLRHYSWYSKEFIEACILPLGQLAEAAQEANNKESHYL